MRIIKTPIGYNTYDYSLDYSTTERIKHVVVYSFAAIVTLLIAVVGFKKKS